MGLGGLELHIFVAAGVVLGCSFVALLVDYLKGNNEKLRESTLEMAVRAEERARVNPATGLLLQAIGELRDEIRSVARPPLTRQEETHPAEFLSFTPRIRPEPAVLDAGLQELLEREPEAVTSPVVEEIYLSDMPPVEEAVPVAIVEEEVELEPAAEPAVAAVEPEAIVEVPAEEPELAQEVEPAGEFAATVEPAVTTEPELEPAVAWEAEPAAELPLAEEMAAAEAAPMMAEEPVEPGPQVAEETPQLVETTAAEETAVEEPSEEHPVALSEIAERVAPKVIRIRVLRTEPPVESSPAETVAAVAPSPAEAPEQPAAQEPEPAIMEDPAALFVPAVEAAAVAEPEPAPEPELEPEPATLFVPKLDPEPVVEPALEGVPATSIAAMAEAVAAAGRKISLGPGFVSGLRKREEYEGWKENSHPFTGLVVAIGVNDFEELKKELAPAALVELRLSITALVESLMGSKDSAAALAEDEFVIILPQEEGAAAQRRLSNISERLWDFQLRSLCTCSVVFSWGASEAKQESFAEAADGAFERMRETQANRKSAAFRKRAVNA